MEKELSAFSARLLAYIKSIGISVRAFERSIGVSNGWVSDVKSKVDINAMSEISLKYPSLNIRWLFSGDGDMLRESRESSDKKLLELCKKLVEVFEQKDHLLHELSLFTKCFDNDCSEQ